MFTCSFFQEDDTKMDVDVVALISIKHGILEIEIYCYLLVLIFLID
jgi:26S proteasome regulatory subunit N3